MFDPEVELKTYIFKVFSGTIYATKVFCVIVICIFTLSICR